MIDISTYRLRIGSFSQRIGTRKHFRASREKRRKQEKSKSSVLLFLLKLIVIVYFLQEKSCTRTELQNKTYKGNTKMKEQEYLRRNCLQKNLEIPKLILHQNCDSEKTSLQKKINLGEYILQQEHSQDWGYTTFKWGTSNFYARYTYGNKQQTSRGIRNMHLNIRSLRNKVSEIKYLVKQHSPHIFGISECELKKVQDQYDETKLKIPGYDLLFPKSWSLHGYARVVMYVKSTLQYEQVHEIEDDVVQSIWIKGGFKNSRKIFFSHFYREHTSTLGNSLQNQRDYLEKFLLQWEKASDIPNGGQPNEIHVSGDMNLDTLNGKWLEPTYHLISLARMVHSACNLGNFSQLVSAPTRSQFNSRSGVTDISCIDHVYTNSRFRCSSVSIHSFGGSDHDLLGTQDSLKILLYQPEPSDADLTKHLMQMNSFET